MKVGIIAGEVSGDILASTLMISLKRKIKDISFVGIGGPLMQQQSCRSLYPIEKLSHMGILEIVSRYRELKKIQTDMIHYFINNPPDVFIGVDVPDFTLDIERALKDRGIPTVHYVSPSVWAWRQYRIYKIERSVDLMLTLFPFEKKFYDNFDLQVEFVGHSLADEIPFEVDQYTARKQLGIDHIIHPYHHVIALLPGSRDAEINAMAPPFLETAILCQQQNPELIFLMPLVNDKHHQFVSKLLQKYHHPPNIFLLTGHSQQVMAASDGVLLASGTATLEALLLKKPMVVCYKMSAVSYWIIRHLAKVPCFSLPNLLSGEKLVDEIAQNDVNAQNLAPRVLSLLDPRKWQDILAVFDDIHHMLQKNASDTAAQTIMDFLSLCQKKKVAAS